MKSVRMAALLGVMVLVGFGASASSVCTDMEWIYDYMREGDVCRYVHDITNPSEGDAYDPSMNCVISAELFIRFKDDGSARFEMDAEKVSIWEDGQFMETITLPDSRDELPNFGYELEECKVDISALTDGILNCGLKATDGDFYVLTSCLKVEFGKCPDQEPIPEPATLLGLGAMGLGAARLRLRRKK